MKIRTLYIFDKYLNRTMNWAYRLMKHLPETQPVIASPTIVENEFFDSDFEFIHSPFQSQTFDNEWDVTTFQKGINYLTTRVYPFYQKFLFRKIKDQKIDIIHIHFGNVACLYLDLVKKLKKPLIVTFHGYDYESILIQKPELRPQYKALFEYASLITCGGQAGKNRLIKIGCPAEKISIVRLGIEPEQIPVFERKKTSNQLWLLQAGTITEKKGHIYTMKAFAKAFQSCPNLQLTFLGEKQDKSIVERLEKIIETNSLLSDCVWFKEILPYDRFLKFSSRYNVFIHPSQTAKTGDCEGGTPLVIQDMAATGMPIISTRHADIEEGVLDGKTGFLSAEKDWEDLAKSIERFYKMNQNEYSEFCKNARRHMEENYRMSDSGLKLQRLYESVIRDS